MKFDELLDIIDLKIDCTSKTLNLIDRNCKIKFGIFIKRLKLFEVKNLIISLVLNLNFPYFNKTVELKGRHSPWAYPVKVKVKLRFPVAVRLRLHGIKLNQVFKAPRPCGCGVGYIKCHRVKSEA